MRTPNWQVRAYTNADKKHCFSRVIIKAANRREARQIVMNFSSEQRKRTGWNAGAGHVITVSPYPLN